MKRSKLKKTCEDASRFILQNQPVQEREIAAFLKWLDEIETTVAIIGLWRDGIINVVMEPGETEPSWVKNENTAAAVVGGAR